jgi:hypothetical protein
MEMEEVIEIWKREGIDHAEYDFNCGGDSMNDTELRFYKENKAIKETWGLSDYFEDEVYKKVEFYVNSFDNYQGESGTVTIGLNEEEDGFEYEKSSTEEWVETYSDVLKVEITKKQACFLEDYIRDMSGGGWRLDEINYKKDFVLKREHEDMIQKLRDEFQNNLEEWAYNQDELSEESESYETSISIIKEDEKFFIELEVSCQVYSYS